MNLLRIQIIPLAFLLVSTHPIFDRGEPHTPEHILLSKGNKGKYGKTLEAVSLVGSSAFTQQFRTCYHFNTTAGMEVFFNIFRAKLDSYIFPDYSDEEIKREVMNMGVVQDEKTSLLRLEEKGSIYAEMITVYEKPFTLLLMELLRKMFGENHTFSYDSGGVPADIRQMKPQHIRDFQKVNYRLNNMGCIVSLSKEVSFDKSLKRINEILNELEPNSIPQGHPEDQFKSIPPIRPYKGSKISKIYFPDKNIDAPGVLAFGWPEVKFKDEFDKSMFELFVTEFASGNTSELYNLFINSDTKVMETGAGYVYSYIDRDTNSLYIGLGNIKRSIADVDNMKKIEFLIHKEMKRIADMKDGSEELKKFNKKLYARITQFNKRLKKNLNSPPRFGFRSTGSIWMDNLSKLHQIGGFKRSLTFKAQIEKISQLLKSDRNIWRDYIHGWKLLESEPYGVAAIADPEFMNKSEKERKERIDLFINGLKSTYKTENDQEAIKKYKEEYDKKTQMILNEEKKIKTPEFINSPPMTQDDLLDYKVEKLKGGKNLVISQFDCMNSLEVGLSFNLYTVPQDYLIYLTALPDMMTEIGVKKDGKIIDYKDMKNHIREEILNLYAYYSSNLTSKRIELSIIGSGGNIKESKNAIQWMECILNSPYLEIENLSRIRDVLDQKFKTLSERMRIDEEHWVRDPSSAFIMRENALYLSTSSFLTEKYNIFRLRWMLKEIQEKNLSEFSHFLKEMVQLTKSVEKKELLTAFEALREEKSNKDFSNNIKKLAKYKSESADDVKKLIDEFINDVKSLFSDIPSETFVIDIERISHNIIKDLEVQPRDVLQNYKKLLEIIKNQNHVRGYMVGNKKDINTIKPMILSIVNSLNPKETRLYDHTIEPLLEKNMISRYQNIKTLHYIGLVHENTRSGVHMNFSKIADINNYTKEDLYKYLVSLMYGGKGAHTVYMKTWAAGLAYGNGVGSNIFDGTVGYYAERCPDLTQTIQFVRDYLSEAKKDPKLSDYIIAQLFSSRSGLGFESRGAAMSDNLEDDISPEKVRKFREDVLKLKNVDDFKEKLFQYYHLYLGQVIPGLNKESDTSTSTYYVIGPESQFKKYEEYLKSTMGDITLYRIYPRDYWFFD